MTLHHKKIVVYEKLIDDFKDLINDSKPTVRGYVLNQTAFETGDGKYDKNSDTVYLSVYWQSIIRHSKQLYSIHGLISLLYLGKQFRECGTINCENDATNFATEFANEYSEEISRIMDWKDEWEIEIES